MHFFTSMERTDNHEFFTVNTGKPQFYSSLEGTYERRLGGQPDLRARRLPAERRPSTCSSATSSRMRPTTPTARAARTRRSAPAMRRFPASRTSSATPRVCRRSIVNELTAMYAESFQDTPFNERYTPAQFSQNGSPRYVFPSLTWGVGPSTHFRNVYRQFRDALSITTGNHVWKMGGGIQWIPLYMGPRGTRTAHGHSARISSSIRPIRTSTSRKLTGATQFAASLPALLPD